MLKINYHIKIVFILFSIVKVILDKSQYNTKRYSSALFFDHMGIPVWIDNKPAIAHNKIIILGNTSTVLSGSYNFSKSAQNRNAENLLIIKSKALVDTYTQNFQKRLSASLPFSSYESLKKNKISSE